MRISFNCFEHCKHEIVAIRAISFEIAVDSSFSDYSRCYETFLCWYAMKGNIEHDLWQKALLYYPFTLRYISINVTGNTSLEFDMMI